MGDPGQRTADALARQDHQAERTHASQANAGAVIGKRLAECRFHFLARRPLSHVDEVEHHQAAEVAQPKLARRGNHRLEVGDERGALRILGIGEAPGVDVDRHKRFRRIDDDRTAGRQSNRAAERIFELLLDVVDVKQRHHVRVQLDLGHRTRDHLQLGKPLALFFRREFLVLIVRVVVCVFFFVILFVVEVFEEVVVRIDVHLGRDHRNAVRVEVVSVTIGIRDIRICDIGLYRIVFCGFVSLGRGGLVGRAGVGIQRGALGIGNLAKGHFGRGGRGAHTGRADGFGRGGLRRVPDPQQSMDLAGRLLLVHDDAGDFTRHDVAHAALGQIALAAQHAGATGLRAAQSDALPLGKQVIPIGFERREVRRLAGCAHNDAHPLGQLELAQQLAHALPLRSLRDPA